MRCLSGSLAREAEQASNYPRLDFDRTRISGGEPARKCRARFRRTLDRGEMTALLHDFEPGPGNSRGHFLVEGERYWGVLPAAHDERRAGNAREQRQAVGSADDGELAANDGISACILGHPLDSRY